MKSDKTILINASASKIQEKLETAKYYIFIFIFSANCLYNVLVNYPQSLEKELLAAPYNFTSFQYGVFFSIMSLPNIVLPLFVGINVDKNGTSAFVILTLSFCSIFGMIVITIGSYELSYTSMVIGRLIMGLGIENISMLLKKFLINITTKEDSVAAWGVFLSSTRIGSIIASGIRTYVSSISSSIPFAFFVGTLIASAMCIFVLFTLILIKKTQIPREKIEISSLQLLKDFKRETPNIFWVLNLIYCFNFCMFYGFFSQANDFLTKLCGIETSEASYLLIVFSSFCAIFQPIIGLVFSSIGYYVYSLLIGALFNILAFGIFLKIFGTEDVTEVLIPIIILAVGYSGCSTFIFSANGWIVSYKNYGLACGIFQNCCNVGFLIGPVYFSYIVDMTSNFESGYFWAIIETIGLQGLIVVLGLCVLFIDRKTINIFSSKFVLSKI